MDVKQAYRILEIPETSTMPEVQQAYRDLAQIWHPDRHSQNERLQSKALQRMKELNIAYDCICKHLNVERATSFTDDELKHKGSAETILVCPECGTKNRVRSSFNDLTARCGRCGSHLLRQQHGRQSATEWEHRILCGDGTCIGIINSSGRCTKCGKTPEEGRATERDNTKRRREQQDQHRLKLSRNTIAYASVLAGLLLFYLLELYFTRSPSGVRTHLQNSTVQGPVRPNPVEPLPPPPEITPETKPAAKKLSATEFLTGKSAMQSSPPSEKIYEGSEGKHWINEEGEFEPINPNRLKTGAAPYTGRIRSGHSKITVDNGTETDSCVRVVRLLKNGGEQKVRNFYICTHDQFVAEDIPPGEYVLRVAYGTDWNPKIRKFNYRKSFSETQTFAVDETTWTETREDSEVLHTESSDISITLHKVPYGNFQTHPINEDEFFRNDLSYRQ